MAKRYRRIALIAVVVVEGAVVGWIIWSAYYSKAWAMYSSSRDQNRFEQLKTLHAALEEYKKGTGEWPPDLEAVRQRYLELLPTMGFIASQRPEEVAEEYRPFVGFPPLTGPHRVEYYNPPLGGKVILRSYGHLEESPGWDLHRDPVTMDVDVRGEVTFPPLGRGSGLPSGTRP